MNNIKIKIINLDLMVEESSFLIYSSQDDYLNDILNNKTYEKYLREVRNSLKHNSIKARAMTRNRGEVVGSYRKVAPQKGRGFARQGSNRAPQRKGGGVVFGPRRNKLVLKKINKKLLLTSLRKLLFMHNQNNHILILEKIFLKTKDANVFLSPFKDGNKKIYYFGKQNIGLSNLSYISYQKKFKYDFDSFKPLFYDNLIIFDNEQWNRIYTQIKK